jgi:hypothetical protein
MGLNWVSLVNCSLRPPWEPKGEGPGGRTNFIDWSSKPSSRNVDLSEDVGLQLPEIAWAASHHSPRGAPPAAGGSVKNISSPQSQTLTRSKSDGRGLKNDETTGSTTRKPNSHSPMVLTRSQTSGAATLCAGLSDSDVAAPAAGRDFGSQTRRSSPRRDNRETHGGGHSPRLAQSSRDLTKSGPGEHSQHSPRHKPTASSSGTTSKSSTPSGKFKKSVQVVAAAEFLDSHGRSRAVR